MEQCSLVMDISGSDSVGSAGQNTSWRWRDKGEIERQIRLAKGMLCENRRRWLPEPLAPSLQTLALASQCSIRSCVRPCRLGQAETGDIRTETRSGMGNCCGREGDSGHEKVLVRHKVARPETDRVIFTIDRYMSLTPF